MMLKNAQTREIMMMSNLTPYRLENLILDDSDDELTEHHDSADGELAQLIKMNQ